MRRVLLSALLVVSALAAMPGLAQAQIVEIGATAPRPAASCPRDCQAVGRVSGFGARHAGQADPYRGTRRGKIVAFTLTLGAPTDEQAQYFTNLFGGPPRARLSVLRPGSRGRLVLTGQSPVFELADYYGSSPTFALPRPLTLKRGYTVALTVPTWAPAFGVNLGENEEWRSSRSPDDCADLRQAAAQQRRGGSRSYGCSYRTARLLYTASFVPDPGRTVRRSRR